MWIAGEEATPLAAAQAVWTGPGDNATDLFTGHESGKTQAEIEEGRGVKSSKSAIGCSILLSVQCLSMSRRSVEIAE
jgi:hypothetical protein